MIKITHPEIPGSRVEVPDSSLPFHQAAGWVLAGSEDDPEVKAKSTRAEGQAAEQPETALVEQDKTPKRRTTTKDGE